MTDLTKDEVVKMAREAGAVFDPQWGIASNTGTATFERFATLCRAPLIAENAALKQAHEINADTLNAMQVEIDDWKARAEAELAQVRAEPTHWEVKQGGRVFVLNAQEFTGKSYDLASFKPLYAAPQPAAQEPVAWRKKSANGEWVLYYQNVGWKDLSGFEPLYPVQKSAAKVVQLTEDQTEELIEDLCNTYGLSGDLEEVVSIVVEFINKAAK